MTPVFPPGFKSFLKPNKQEQFPHEQALDDSGKEKLSTKDPQNSNWLSGGWLFHVTGRVENDRALYRGREKEGEERQKQR